jgi:hypothetical protein
VTHAPGPEELASRLRQRRTASFRYGWAWGSPEIPPDGLRGVGTADFEQRETRVVGVAIPPRVVRQMRAISFRHPLRWLFFGLLGRKLEHQAASEHRFGGEGGAGPGIPNPLWPALVLDAPLGAPEVSALDSQVELQVDLTHALDLLPADLAKSLRKGDGRLRGTPLHVSLADDGVPDRIAISPSDSAYSDETFWRVVEFTRFGVDCEGVDLWAEWSQR